MLWLIQRHDGKKEKSWTILRKPNNHSSVQNDWPNVYFQTSVRPSFFAPLPLHPSKPALPLVYVVETCLMWCYIVEIWDVSNGLEFFSYLVCVFNEILPFLIQFDLGRHTHTHTHKFNLRHKTRDSWKKTGWTIPSIAYTLVQISAISMDVCLPDKVISARLLFGRKSSI